MKIAFHQQVRWAEGKGNGVGGFIAVVGDRCGFSGTSSLARSRRTRSQASSALPASGGFNEKRPGGKNFGQSVLFVTGINILRFLYKVLQDTVVFKI